MYGFHRVLLLQTYIIENIGGAVITEGLDVCSSDSS
jgi:hypothetical protein